MRIPSARSGTRPRESHRIARVQRRDDLVRDLRIAPEGALLRVRGAINRRKRLLGILKTGDEFVGFVGEDSFEIWERQSHAVHATGRVQGRRGGTRLEMRSVLTRRARVLLLVMTALYAAAAYGVAAMAEGSLSPPAKIVIVLGGAVALATIFFVSARRQRRALAAFVDGLFRDVEVR